VSGTWILGNEALSRHLRALSVEHAEEFEQYRLVRVW
jgi:hypothetical protein